MNIFERYAEEKENEMTRWFMLADSYYLSNGGDNCSEIVIFKYPYRWGDIKKVCENVTKRYDENPDDFPDGSLYDYLWNELENNFEVECSASVEQPRYFIEW